MKIKIAILAIASVAGWFWMAQIAREFVWGEGHAERPILPVMWALGAEWAVWGIVVWLATKAPLAQRKSVALLCCVAGLSSQLFFLNSNPILEHDGYRYLWDGAALDSGVGPYRYAPQEIADARLSDELEDSKRKLTLRIQNEPAAASTLAKVGYPEVKTIYPPAAQAVFFTAFKMGGWSWSGLRLIFIGAYFAGVFLTAAALRENSTDNSMAFQAVALLSMCPLAIKEIGSSAHLDAMLVLYFGAMLFVVSRDTIFTPIWIAVSVGVLMALAIATKLYPLIAMPVVSAWFGARYSWRIAGVNIGVALLFTAGSFIPFLAMGERDFFSGLSAFGNTWLRNESVFGIIQSAATFAVGSETVAIAKIPGGSGPLGMVVAKLVAAIALLAVCAVCTWNVLRTAREQPPALVISRNLALLFLAWFLLLPMAFPWYFLGILPCLACARLGAIPWVLIACAAVFYYGEFYIDGHDLPKNYSTRLLQIEYGIPLTFALCVWASRALSSRAAMHAPRIPEGK